MVTPGLSHLLCPDAWLLAGVHHQQGRAHRRRVWFTSVLLRILEQERPDYLVVAFDTGKTFRDDLFPEYKGTREKMPDDLRTQIERIRQLVTPSTSRVWKWINMRLMTSWAAWLAGRSNKVWG